MPASYGTGSAGVRFPIAAQSALSCSALWAAISSPMSDSLTIEQQYQHHAANLRSVDEAIDQMERAGKNALRRVDAAATTTATRLITLLLSAAAESRLQKLLHDASVRADDRDRVLAVSEHRQRWIAAIDTGFRRQFGLGPHVDVGQSLSVTQRARRRELHDAIGGDL